MSTSKSFGFANTPIILLKINSEPLTFYCHECQEPIEKNHFVQVEVGNPPYKATFHLHTKCYVNNKIKPDDFCKVNLILLD